MKTLSVRDLSSKGASSAVAAAETEPVLITKHGEPAVWMVAARKLAALAAERGGEEQVYRRALELIAVDLFDREVLSLGQASRLVGIALSDFIDLCARLRVPVLREPEEGIEAELASFDAWLGGRESVVPPATDGARPLQVDRVRSIPLTASFAVRKRTGRRKSVSPGSEYLMTEQPLGRIA